MITDPSPKSVQFLFLLVCCCLFVTTATLPGTAAVETVWPLENRDFMRKWKRSNVECLAKVLTIACVCTYDVGGRPGDRTGTDDRDVNSAVFFCGASITQGRRPNGLVWWLTSEPPPESSYFLCQRCPSFPRANLKPHALVIRSQKTIYLSSSQHTHTHTHNLFDYAERP